MGALAGVENGALIVQIAEEVALASPIDLKASEIHSPRHDPVCPNFETDLVASGSLTKDGGETYNNNLSTFIAKCTEALVKGAIDLLIHNRFEDPGSLSKGSKSGPLGPASFSQFPRGSLLASAQCSLQAPVVRRTHSVNP